jgi:predicted permease
MVAFFADFRFALRSLRRTPWFAGFAVLILTLGIGANTALFSLLDAVLFKGLPYKDPHRLVMVAGQDAERSGTRLPIPLFESVRDRAATIAAISAYNAAGGILRTEDGPVDIRGRHVSANFVELMGVPPLAGRGFLPEEEGPDAPPVLVITFGLWQQRLGGDPEAVGKTIYMNDTPYTVVGIMPPGFGGYLGGSDLSDYWTPYADQRLREFELERGHEPIARLAAGVSMADALRELDAIRETVAPEGWSEQGRTLAAVPLKADVLGDSAYPLQLLLAAVGVVLMIACANLAQLLLARSDGRMAEFATRKAIGAPASRLFRLSLIESCILSLAGGCGGIALAYWLLPVMLALAPAEIPRIAEAAIDGRVLLATVALCGMTGCVFGLAPALRLSRLSVVEAMKRTPGSLIPHKARFHAGLVVVQVASSVALCVLAGLIGRSFLTLLPTEPGFEAASRMVHLLSMETVPYPQRAERLGDLLQRVGAIPDIRAVAYGTNVPFASDDGIRAIRDPGGAGEMQADIRVVTANYFQLLQMPMVHGRLFAAPEPSDGAGVAIVNQTLARKIAPEGEVVGHIIERRSGDGWLRSRIVGVVADSRSSGQTVDVRNELYLPLSSGVYVYGYLIVQSPLEAGVIDRLLREQIHAWEPTLPDVPWLTATRIEDLMSASVAGPRFAATLSSAFSGLALLLAATGVFGLVSYSVSQRLREFGIRAALGAQPGDLLSTALGSAVVSTGAGVAAGLAATIYLVRFVESQLYAVEALDLPTFAAAGAVMLSVAIFSAYLPARRAAQVDPAETLRAE